MTTDLPDPDKKPKPTQEDIAQAETVDLRGKANIFDGLPEFLKHPKNYKPIEKALLETLNCPKSHSDPLEMTQCKRCTENMLKRRQLMTKLGFKSPAQYMKWKETHEKIKEMVEPERYKKMVDGRI